MRTLLTKITCTETNKGDIVKSLKGLWSQQSLSSAELPKRTLEGKEEERREGKGEWEDGKGREGKEEALPHNLS